LLTLRGLFDMLKLTKLLEEHLEDVHDTKKCYELAREYDRRGLCAAAVPFYLRACDKEWDDILLQYKALLRMSVMYMRLGRRVHTAESIMMDAAQLMPQRREAWYHLTVLNYKRQHETSAKKTLMFSRLALSLEEPEEDIDVEYPGEFALKYYNAWGDWKTKGLQESKELTLNAKLWHEGFRHPDYVAKMDELLAEHGWPKAIRYTSDLYDQFRYYFDGLQTVSKNYSRRLQDMIVLTLNEGKRNGFYIEIGAMFGDHNNNTYLLEKEYGWKGLTIDADPRLAKDYKKKRDNYVICKDPLEIDYKDFFYSHSLDPVIDYLQIDHRYAGYQLIKDKIPFDDYRFKVISWSIPDINDAERIDYRSYMRNKGYTLLEDNIFYSGEERIPAMEDIWVYAPLINGDLFNEIMRNNKHKTIVDGWFAREQS